MWVCAGVCVCVRERERERERARKRVSSFIFCFNLTLKVAKGFGGRRKKISAVRSKRQFSFRKTSAVLSAQKQNYSSLQKQLNNKRLPGKNISSRVFEQFTFFPSFGRLLFVSKENLGRTPQSRIMTSNPKWMQRIRSGLVCGSRTKLGRTSLDVVMTIEWSNQTQSNGTCMSELSGLQINRFGFSSSNNSNRNSSNANNSSNNSFSFIAAPAIAAAGVTAAAVASKGYLFPTQQS